MLMGTFAVTTLVTSIAEVEAVPKQVAASLEVASETTEAMTVSTAVIVEELFGETIRGLSHLPTLAGVLRVQRTYFFVIGEPPRGGLPGAAGQALIIVDYTEHLMFSDKTSAGWLVS